MLKCNKCGIEKPLELFHKGRSKIGRRQPCAACRYGPPRPKPIRDCRICGTIEKLFGTSRYCWPCWYKQYKSTHKAADHRKRRYGITQEDFDKMKKAQNDSCAICHRFNVRIVVDHCHRTNRVRGLLCDRCNAIIGIWNDDPEVACRAVEYLS